MEKNKDTFVEIERYQSKRADEMADVMRRYVVGLNTGGMTTIVYLLSNKWGEIYFLIWPSVSFLVGLLISGISINKQKSKAIDRRDAARRKTSEPDFKSCLLDRNQTYDIASAFFFFAGAGMLVLEFLVCATR